MMSMKNSAWMAILVWLLAGWSSAAAQNVMPGQQVEQVFTADDSAEVPYLLYLPADYDPQEDRKWPLHLFLHGRGESHGPLDLVTTWGPPRMAARGDDLPFLLVSPQCPADDEWKSPVQQTRVIHLLDMISSRYAVDPDRVVLSGLSMGGFGSWRLAADHAERFAAVVPICGGGDPQDAEQLKSLPIWVWHGDRDDVIPITESQSMVDAIRAAGGTDIRFTTLEHVGHNSWSAAYGSPELFQWLSRQQR